MNKKIAVAGSSALLLALPFFAFAFQPIPMPGAGANVNTIIDSVFNILWPVFGGFSVIAFILAGFLFLTANGDGGQVRTARAAVLWGVVGVAVGILAFSIPWAIKFALGV